MKLTRWLRHSLAARVVISTSLLSLAAIWIASKNRNGNVAVKLAYQLTGNSIVYSNVEPNKDEENEE